MNTEKQLPEGWVWTTLGEIRFDLAKGIVPGNFPEQFFELYSVPNFDLGMPEIVQGKEIKSNKQIVDSDTVLLCKINPRLNRAWTVANFSQYMKIGSTEWIPFFNVSMIAPMYLCYYLRQISVRDYFAANASGVGGSLMRINDSIVDHYPFTLPPLLEQHRIVAAIEQQFTRLDSAVASLKSAQARIKQYRASLLKSAVEGEMTKAWRAEHPANETGEQLLKRILIERRKRWEEEQLAKMREKGSTPKDATWKLKYNEPQGPDVENLSELPEGWYWATVDQVGNVQLGRQRAPQHHTGTYMRPYLRVANVFEDRIDTSDIMSMNFTPEEFKTYSLKYGDILLNEGQSLELLGRPAVYKDEVPGACFQNTLIRFSVSSDLLAEYALIVFRSYMHTGKFQKIGKHTTNIAHLGAGRFAILEFPLPPLLEQEQIVAEAESKLSNIAQLEATIETDLKRAEHERQSILQEAFAGRLVPQDPDDEPASILLERIREEREQREEVKKTSKESRKGGLMGSVKKRQVGKSNSGQQEVDLYKTLVAAGQSLPPDELFKQAGLQVDEQPESVEIFYAELHIDVEEGLIRVLQSDNAPVLLEALEPSAEVAGHTAESEAPVQLQEMEIEATDTQMRKAESDKKIQSQGTLWDL